MPKYNDFDLDLQNQATTSTKSVGRTIKLSCNGEYSVCLLCPYTYQPDCRTEVYCANII